MRVDHLIDDSLRLPMQVARLALGPPQDEGKPNKRDGYRGDKKRLSGGMIVFPCERKTIAPLWTCVLDRGQTSGGNCGLQVEV
jgi:hypothetical protein